MLRSDHAALVASFLHRVFVAPNVRVMAAADLAEALEDELYALRQHLGEDAFPKPGLDYLNDWAGDDAIITKVHDEIRKFNYMGDVQRVTGEVLAKRQEHGNEVVDVAVKFTNQRGDETVRGTATIALPSKARPLPLYPPVPTELAEKATKMMARHYELGGD